MVLNCSLRDYELNEELPDSPSNLYFKLFAANFNSDMRLNIAISVQFDTLDAQCDKSASV